MIFFVISIKNNASKNKINIILEADFDIKGNPAICPIRDMTAITYNKTLKNLNKRILAGSMILLLLASFSILSDKTIKRFIINQLIPKYNIRAINHPIC